MDKTETSKGMYTEWTCLCFGGWYGTEQRRCFLQQGEIIPKTQWKQVMKHLKFFLYPLKVWFSWRLSSLWWGVEIRFIWHFIGHPKEYGAEQCKVQISPDRQRIVIYDMLLGWGRVHQRNIFFKEMIFWRGPKYLQFCLLYSSHDIQQRESPELCIYPFTWRWQKQFMEALGVARGTL